MDRPGFVDFINLQKESLLYELKNRMAECLSATTKERLFRHAKTYNWEISVLPKTDFGKVLIIKKQGSKIPEIWVCSTYTKYRAAFNKYLFEYFNISEKIPQKYHVDHSLPKSRFGKNFPDYFIRLFLINHDVNCSYGAVFEKTFYQFESTKKPSGGFHVDLIATLKIFGYSLIAKKSTHTERNEWALITSKKLEKDGLENWEWHSPGLLSLIYRGYQDLNLEKTINSKHFTVQLYQEHV
ncbi:hypothetical protein K7I13_05740 [Brucepastera parasyntrophica]|uniref:hypothetical protein n=1 Tax=Brucepastera parasyntrophica TaxID=2880008 RepID=UPI00210C6B2D|nr:hypothetical protein [Brucepastera parasyntrophica]ULQ60769.1 hypothetical protein K7I13_05740 [Brucepastera parasyntrophica]